ncbi:signal transduction histidine kinase [Mycobacterium sp. MAA66]|uniref:sensor histidine kinase n=1 Tax=Mycobacterium sp. MAA66 TaxID=3156297 RepID=UPI003510E53B
MDWLRDFAMRRRGLVSYEFPFTVPIVMYTGSLMVGGTAAVQRDFTRPWLLAAAFLLALGPILLFIVFGVKPVPLAAAACVLTAVAMLLSWPPITLDAAPFLLMFMLGEVFALGSLRDGLLAGAASALLLIGAYHTGHLDTPLQYLLFFLAIAAMIGRILQLQQRLVLKERDRQAARTQQATADERRRIAREIHDVIAHSLSVTMLHLTGARRALQEDHDVEEAVDGLLDAERLGRQAMSDIRRTVGLLGTGPREDPTAAPPPEPGMADIPDLVSTFATAGLRVDSHIDGAPDTVTAGVGLALYRVAQESLANIAKHAPASNADLQLRVAADAAVLTVRNDLPPGTRTPRESGSGLSGMRQRIEVLDGQFRAGPDLDGWTVQARVPISVDVSPCPIIRKHLHRNRVSHD